MINVSNHIKVQGLELLRPNHAGALQFKNGSTANYGVIEVTDDKLVYFTGKGLREIWKPNMTEEENAEALKLKQTYFNGDKNQLITSGHIAITPLEEIDRIIF